MNIITAFFWFVKDISARNISERNVLAPGMEWGWNSMRYFHFEQKLLHSILLHATILSTFESKFAEISECVREREI